MGKVSHGVSISIEAPISNYSDRNCREEFVKSVISALEEWKNLLGCQKYFFKNLEFGVIIISPITSILECGDYFLGYILFKVLRYNQSAIQ